MNISYYILTSLLILNILTLCLSAKNKKNKNKGGRGGAKVGKKGGGGGGAKKGGGGGGFHGFKPGGKGGGGGGFKQKNKKAKNRNRGGDSDDDSDEYDHDSDDSGGGMYDILQDLMGSGGGGGGKRGKGGGGGGGFGGGGKNKGGKHFNNKKGGAPGKKQKGGKGKGGGGGDQFEFQVVYADDDDDDEDYDDDDEDYDDDDEDEEEYYSSEYERRKQKKKQKQKAKFVTFTTEPYTGDTTFETTTLPTPTTDASLEKHRKGMRLIDKLKHENWYELQRYGLTTQSGFWEDWTATYTPMPDHFINSVRNYSHLHWNNKMSDRTLYVSCPTRFREVFFGTRHNGEGIFLHQPNNNIWYLKPHEVEWNVFEHYEEVKDFLAIYHPDKSVHMNATVIKNPLEDLEYVDYNNTMEHYEDEDNTPVPLLPYLTTLKGQKPPTFKPFNHNILLTTTPTPTTRKHVNKKTFKTTTRKRYIPTSKTTRPTFRRNAKRKEKKSSTKCTIDSSDQLRSFEKNPNHAYSSQW